MRRVPAFLAVALIAAAGAARADGADVAYSSTARGKGCRTIALNASDNDHGPVVLHCGGTAGFGVRIEYLGAAVLVKIARGDLAKAPMTVGAPHDVGPAIEWRGVRAANGFRPQTAIIRLVSRIDEKRTASALAVLKIDGNTVCPAAFIDANAVKNANEEARSVADRIAATFKCGTDKPVAVGPVTELLEDIAGRGGVQLK
jgi:hypothetical protein